MLKLRADAVWYRKDKKKKKKRMQTSRQTALERCVKGETGREEMLDRFVRGVIENAKQVVERWDALEVADEMGKGTQQVAQRSEAAVSKRVGHVPDAGRRELLYQQIAERIAARQAGKAGKGSPIHSAYVRAWVRAVIDIGSKTPCPSHVPRAPSPALAPFGCKSTSHFRLTPLSGPHA